MSMERTLSMMLFLCALTISVKAQSPAQNYVMSKDVLDVDGTHAITTVTIMMAWGILWRQQPMVLVVWEKTMGRLVS